MEHAQNAKEMSQKVCLWKSNETRSENRAYCGQPSYPSDQPYHLLWEVQTGSLTFPITVFWLGRIQFTESGGKERSKDHPDSCYIHLT